MQFTILVCHLRGRIYNLKGGWSDGATVLTSSARAPYNLDDSRARAYCACSGGGGHFYSPISSSGRRPVIDWNTVSKGRETQNNQPNYNLKIPIFKINSILWKIITIQRTFRNCMHWKSVLTDVFIVSCEMWLSYTSPCIFRWRFVWSWACEIPRIWYPIAYSTGY